LDPFPTVCKLYRELRSNDGFELLHNSIVVPDDVVLTGPEMLCRNCRNVVSDCEELMKHFIALA
jgi:hypothetical protein